MAFKNFFNIAFLGDGDGAVRTITNDFHVEDPMRLAKIGDGKDGRKLFFEREDDV